jgi:hypothetical protein
MKESTAEFLKWLRVVLVVVLLAAGTALRLDGFTERWPDDWRGSMGCLYDNIARNYLAFGFAATKGAPVMSITPDSLSDAEYYLHHPPLTGWYVALSVEIFHSAEWPPRIVPLALSVMSLLLIYIIGKKLWGWVAGIAAMAVMAFLPGAVFYGWFVDPQGPVPVFFILWTVLAYLRFCEKRSWPRLAHVLAAFLLGALTDWPVYYLAALLPLHHLIFCRERSWKIIALAVTGFSAFALFWVWSAWVEGIALADIPRQFISLAASRFNSQAAGQAQPPAQPLGAYVNAIFGSSFIHFFGIACTVLFIAGLCLLAWRLWRRTSLQSDGIPAVLTVLGLLYLFMFLKISSLHEYMVCYLMPPLALCIGMMLGALAAAFRRRPVLAVAAVIVPLLLYTIASYATARQNLDRTSYAFSLDASATGSCVFKYGRPGLLIPATDFPMFQHFAMYVPGKIFQADINRLNLAAAAADPRVAWIYIDSIGPDGDDPYSKSLRLFKRAIIKQVLPDDKMADPKSRTFRMRCGVLSNPQTVLGKIGKLSVAPLLLDKKTDGDKIRLRWKYPWPDEVLAYIVYARPAGRPFFSMVEVVTGKTDYEYTASGPVELAVTAIGKNYEESSALVTDFNP